MKEINPALTTRAYAYKMWMQAPMPMVTFFKTLDITNLARISKKKGLKLNMLMCWCIGKAASGIKEFYMLPVGKKLIQYDTIAVNTIVANKNGEVSSCDIPFSEDLNQFNHNYLQLTKQVAETCQNHDLTESMVIIWGKFKKRFFRKHLTVSFQFHHTQMDGAHAAQFLEKLQHEINSTHL